MKATAVAPSNVGLIKYWGKKDTADKLPINGSISMNLSNLQTTTTVEFLPNNTSQNRNHYDEVIFNGQPADGQFTKKVSVHLDILRKQAGVTHHAKVTTKNNFPTATGLSSSASGFASLTLAGAKALSLKLSEKELSIIARQGSGSASRSIPDGFVEWHDGDSSETSYAESIFPAEYWDICDVVVITNSQHKKIPSTDGMELAYTSPLYEYRIDNTPHKLVQCKEYIKNRDFTAFGQLIEAEMLEMHAVIMTSTPPLIYWKPETLRVMHAVRAMRDQGLEAYVTINTGHDVHVFTQKKDVIAVTNLLKKEGFENIIENVACDGARIIE